MKKFENKTKNQKEKSIKIGSSVPHDAVNLAFYSNEQVNPSNNLSVIDLSSSIPENKTALNSGVKTFFANELGILEDENGNTLFPTENLTISDVNISKVYTTEMLEETQINSLEYLHYYYASRFFTAAPAGYSFLGFEDYLNENRIKFLNIKVIDSKNQDYIDKNTGRKKYKILLEPYLTQENSEEPDIPYRIVVGLDATEPINLKLIYDKVECDSSGKIVSQNLRYSETINAQPYFKNMPEETYVVDNSYGKKLFSIKKYNKKYSDIFSSKINSTGNNVYVPKKALADNRTFEIFNWRLIARSKQSLNYELVDYFAGIEQDATSSSIKFRNINAAVIYDSNDTTSLANIKPYVFYRMQNSPFNFSKFIFSNPLSNTQEKNTANYWMVDINSIDSLSQFDVVAFAPTKVLSEKANLILSNYVKIHNGTLIVDGSNYPSGKPFISSEIFMPEVNFSTAVVRGYYEYNEQNKILNEDKNGGWNINSSIFENEDYGIFGLKKANYRYLNSEIPLSKSFLNVGVSSSDKASVGALFEFGSQGDSVTQGNIIFTTFSFMEYCNSIYSSSGLSTVLNSNTESISIDEIDQDVISSIVEGPFKFLYNCISYAMYSRAYAGTVLDTRSSIFNYVGQWNSSWVMNSNALLNSEIEKYFTNISISPTKSRYARDLIKGYNSVQDFYLKSIYDHLPTYHKDKISYIDISQVEFFVEITNPDIEIYKSTKISDKLVAISEYNLPTSYTLFKLDSGTQKAHAYTETESPIINIPDSFGPYVVKEISTIKSSSTKQLNNEINPVNYFDTYPFELETFYSYQTATDKPLVFNGNYKTNLEISYRGTGELDLKKKTGYAVRKWTEPRIVGKEPAVTRPPQTIPGAISTLSATGIKSIFELFAPQGTIPANAGNQWRAFDYTGDIDLGNGPDGYNIGARGNYVGYIQRLLKVGGFYRSNIDWFYGPVTKKAVADFQEFMKAYKPVWSVDGIVDSETKALFAFAIKNNIRGMQDAIRSSEPIVIPRSSVMMSAMTVLSRNITTLH